MQQLLIKAKQGDKAAIEQIITYLRVRFVLLAKRRIGEEHCEDIAQEACITILEKLKDDSPEDNFEAWAYQVLRNKIGNYLQSSNLRQKRMVSTEHIDYLDKPTVSDLNPVFRRRLIDCLKKLIKSNRRYARVLNLTHQGYQTEEICQRMAMKSNHLYVVLNRSRKLLNECLDGGA